MGKRDSKKSSGDKGPDPNAWMLTFSDLITLLLTFFVLLLTMSSMDAKQFKESFAAIVTPIEIVETSGKGTFIEPIIIMQTAQEDLMPLTTEESIIMTFENIIKKGKFQSVKLFNTEAGIVIKLEESILFDRFEAELKPEAKELINQFIPDLARVQFPMYVEGHTDQIELPRESEFHSHLDLSSERALNTLLYILNNSKIKQDQISFRGYGSGKFKELSQFNLEHNIIEIVIDTQQTTFKG